MKLTERVPIKIAANSIAASKTAKKNAVKQATSSNSNMGIYYYVFGCEKYKAIVVPNKS